MQLLRLGRFIDSDWEKFDIWLWEIYGFSITFVRVKIRVSKMSGEENPSGAQTKYLGPEPLQRHTRAFCWVPVNGQVRSTTKVRQEDLFC